MNWIVAGLLVLLPSMAQAAPKWDFLIIHARIVDGTGSPWFRGSVALAGGRIAWIGATIPSASKARTIIDAKDRVLAPGFVDLMAHDTLTYVTDPGSAASKLSQGITLHLHVASERRRQFARTPKRSDPA
jgi:N-acyl-D-amino-acid deacylase